ncbi:hypothetical protein ACHAPO_010405 [Fusarium lateritium]
MVSSSSSLSSVDDDKSYTSTVEWDHESFETFQFRVMTLAWKTIWPEASSIDDKITVERLKGGGFNRIIGITRQSPYGEKTEYILRMPRLDATQVDHDVAALQFVRRNTKIPVPRVVMFDETEYNALGVPYGIQNRIRGVDLISTYPDLNHQDRCRFAREFGRIFRQMLNVRSNKAGRLVMPSDDKSMTAPIHVAAFRSTDPCLTTPFNSSSPSEESVYKMLENAFNAQKNDMLERRPKEKLGPRQMDEFIQMASELEASGWFANQHYYSLAHLDLAPRNILVDPTSNKAIISAILDWDSAILAPMFMSCAPPMWIWDWKDDEEEDEREANNPPTPEGQELKRIFDKAAGKRYCRLAYEPAYRVARRLVQFAIDPMRSNESMREAEVMFREWAEMMRAREAE